MRAFLGPFLGAAEDLRRHPLRALWLAVLVWAVAWAVQTLFDTVYGSLLGPSFGWDPFGLGGGEPPLGSLNSLAFANLLVPLVIGLLVNLWVLVTWAREGAGLVVPISAMANLLALVLASVLPGVVLGQIGVAVPKLLGADVAVIWALLWLGPVLLGAPLGGLALGAVQAAVATAAFWAIATGLGPLEGMLSEAIVGPPPDWRVAAGTPRLVAGILVVLVAAFIGAQARQGAQ